MRNYNERNYILIYVRSCLCGATIRSSDYKSVKYKNNDKI
jgi:hypothetical protein